MASYADFSIKDRTKLKEYIKMKLGGGIISIPITEKQLDFAIDEALEIYSERVHYDLDYYLLDTKNVSLITKENPNGNYDPELGFKLPDNIVSVNNIHEGDNYWFSNQGTTMDFMLYNTGMYPQFSSTNFPGNGVFLDVYLAQDYLKQCQQMFGYKYNFNYNERSKFLKLDPDPQKQRNYQYKKLILEVSTIRPEYQLLGERHVKNLALAHAMMMVGTVWSAYGSGVTLPGGGQLNGDDMYNKGSELKDKVLEELNSYEPPMMWFQQQ